MKTLLILASFAALTTAALANLETRSAPSDESVGVLPEFVVTARKVAGTESVGVLPEFVVTARRSPQTAPNQERAAAARATESALPNTIAATSPIVGTISRM